MNSDRSCIRALSLLVVLTIGGLPGCQHSSPAIAPTQGTHQSVTRAETPPSTPTQRTQFAEPPADNLAGGSLIQEAWDAISIQSSRVGFVRTTIANVKLDGRELVRTSSFLRITMNREGHPTTQEMEFASWDTPRGEFVKFESRIKAGPGQIVATGAVRSGQLEINQSTLGQNQSVKIPWASGWRGPFAVEQSLSDQPIKPGERRSTRCLLAALNVPGDVQIEALDYESVDLPVGAQKLLKV